jgi:hypothetical protein
MVTSFATQQAVRLRIRSREADAISSRERLTMNYSVRASSITRHAIAARE